MATHRPQPECRETTRSLLSTSATAPVARRLADKAMPTSRHPARLLRHLPLRVQQLHSRQRLQLPPRLHLLQRLLEVPHLLQPQRLLLPPLRQRLQDLARQRDRARYRGLAQHRHPAPSYSRKPLRRTPCLWHAGGCRGDRSRVKTLGKSLSPDNSIQVRGISRGRKNFKNFLYVSGESMRQMRFTSTSVRLNCNQGIRHHAKNNAHQSDAHARSISGE
jgi:hypothetical protein